MNLTPERPLLDAMRALTAALNEAGARYMIIAGIAVILRGIARVTNDVDATVWGADVDLERLVETLRQHGVTTRIPEALDFARRHQVLLLRHEVSSTPMELSLAWLPFEDHALQRAERITVHGINIPVACAEDLLIYKVIAWRDRDRSDAERLIVQRGHEINLDRVRAVLREFAEALEDPERLAEFERLVDRARAV